jgi:phosphohistidine phosphatase
MRLILLRHAKSAWDTDAATDHERPLSARGRKDAPRIGAELERRGWLPDVVLASDAQRTQETWARMAPHLAPDAPVSLHADLYMANVADVMALLEQQEDETVLVVGHNPCTELMVAILSGETREVTTCNAALLESSAEDWSQAIAGRWTLRAMVRPKALG